MLRLISYLISFLGFIFFNHGALSQQINAYAQVTGIAGTTLTVNNINQTYGSFSVGSQIIVMQMQDSVLGSNTSNTSYFGDIAYIVSAGLYEVATIASLTPVTGIPTTITVSAPLTNTYTISPNSSVQIISFPQLGSPNYTVASALSAVNWNGNTGGVLAFQVTGTLTLANNLSADGAGFRGGSISTNYFDGTLTCDNSIYYSSDNTYATKGEGIYKSNNINYSYARGKIINGGGGGDRKVNGGGGGGGNYTNGGNAGAGYNGTLTGCTEYQGGIGGIDLSSYISLCRIFMGGGGGGGQQNNSLGTNGANGGGVIIIKANQIVTTGTCSGIIISANGLTASNPANDGAGGGGAGGTILFNTTSWNISSSCPVTVRANGGNGGNIIYAATHSGGGGGGQGAIIYSTALPANISNSTTNGNAGCDNDFSPCTLTATSGGGSNGAGILANVSSICDSATPVKLLSFNAILENGIVKLNWATATEINNNYFTIERSIDTKNWETIAKIKGVGNSSEIINYEYTDSDPFKNVTSYYRLKQTDLNGSYTYSNIKTVDLFVNNCLSLYPNPTKDKFYLTGCVETIEINLYNELMQEIPLQFINSENKITIILPQLPCGMYIAKLTSSNTQTFHRLIIE